MKLIKEVIPEAGKYPRRYLLLSEVTDEDAKILTLCGMIRKENLDEHGAEAFMTMGSGSYLRWPKNKVTIHE